MIIEEILFFGMISVVAIAMILSIIFMVIFSFFSKDACAKIIGIEEKKKYADSSRRKQTAYDYVYEYHDDSYNKYIGRIIRNIDEQEYAIGDEVTVKYLKFSPSRSLYYDMYKPLKFVPIISSVILLILLIFYFI